MKDLKEYLDGYDGDYDLDKYTALAVLVIKILNEISLHLENIANKMWE